MGRPQKPIKHGTLSGYQQHIARGQRTCSSCRRTWRNYYTAYWRARDRRQAAEKKAAKLARLTAHVDQTTPQEVIDRFIEESNQ